MLLKGAEALAGLQRGPISSLEPDPNVCACASSPFGCSEAECGTRTWKTLLSPKKQAAEQDLEQTDRTACEGPWGLSAAVGAGLRNAARPQRGPGCGPRSSRQGARVSAAERQRCETRAAVGINPEHKGSPGGCQKCYLLLLGSRIHALRIDGNPGERKERGRVGPWVGSLGK